MSPRATRPDAYVERLWADEEWTRGCYGCHMPTGAWTGYGPALREPIGRLRVSSPVLYGRRFLPGLLVGVPAATLDVAVAQFERPLSFARDDESCALTA